MLPLLYNWKNLFVRKQSMALTFAVAATLAFVLSVLLSFVAGIRASVEASGSPRNIVVLAPGATAESTSLILPEQVALLAQVEGLAMDAAGAPLISGEIYVQTTTCRRNSADLRAHVGVRGVDDAAFGVHAEVRVVQGRCFEAGAREVIVGRAAARRYADLEIGREIPLGRMGNRMFSIVGTFEAGGGALENEIWAPRAMLADVYDRRLVSSVHLRVREEAAVANVLDRITGSAVNLSARSERDYYEELLVKTREVVSLATFLIAVMAMGTVFAVASTMFAAVDGRRREVGMLRALGFGKATVGLAFVIEGMLVCALAAGVGLLGSAVTSGAPRDFLSDSSWTAIAYERRITPAIGLIALGVCCGVGALGALVPALRAARTNPVVALRRV